MVEEKMLYYPEGTVSCHNIQNRKILRNFAKFWESFGTCAKVFIFTFHATHPREISTRRITTHVSIISLCEFCVIKVQSLYIPAIVLNQSLGGSLQLVSALSSPIPIAEPDWFFN